MEDYQLKFFPGVYRATHAGQGASSSWCKYNNHILQLVVSSLYLAAAAAALITGPFARKYGRKVRVLLWHTLHLAIWPWTSAFYCFDLCICSQKLV